MQLKIPKEKNNHDFVCDPRFILKLKQDKIISDFFSGYFYSFVDNVIKKLFRYAQ